jgi:sulfate adenylyltransferase subunit 2
MLLCTLPDCGVISLNSKKVPRSPRRRVPAVAGFVFSGIFQGESEMTSIANNIVFAHLPGSADASTSGAIPAVGEGHGQPVRERLNHIQLLEAESIHIIREVAAEFERPVMLYSIGKDSSVMLRLAQKAFHPAPIPFPLLHVDTGYKFREMLEFRDRYTAELGLKLLVWRNEEALADGANPIRLGTQRCCGLLKTQALLDGLRAYNFDAAFGGARRDEEKSRAKERIFSFRDSVGQWDPKNQRPELWSLFNGRIGPGESIRVFPLSNWTELDIWHYIHLEKIPIVPLYLAKERKMLVRGDSLIPVEQPFVQGLPGEEQWVKCRLRSLGCSPCTGAIRSDADTVPKIIAELMAVRNSERANRIIDHDQDGSMELKKREGYF